MAAPKLTNEQRAVLLTWLAAEYTGSLIRKWFADQEWPPPTDAALSYYREKWTGEIEAARSERRSSALSTGLALKEERVKRLVEHADELEAIKWDPDDKGRLWNEKAWRETLDDIAKEMGHRRTGVDLTLEREIEAFLDRCKDKLSPEEYARIVTLAAGSTAA